MQKQNKIDYGPKTKFETCRTKQVALRENKFNTDRKKPFEHNEIQKLHNSYTQKRSYINFRSKKDLMNYVYAH